MNLACACCGGGSGSAPLPTTNRPGLTSIAGRIGTHATFFDAMKTRLSSPEHRAGLLGLGARDAGDPAIALLDAWATVADVLTFYQERIANEGYLRTAVDPRSVVEIARLVGYQPRPGVSASAYLAYMIDANNAKVLIPKGAKAQSVPGPNETAQTFETSAALEARPEWNQLAVRKTRPQNLIGTKKDQKLVDVELEGENKDTLYFEGTSTQLRANDRLLFDFVGASTPVVKTILTVEEDHARSWTKVVVDSPPKLSIDTGVHHAIEDEEGPALSIRSGATRSLAIFEKNGGSALRQFAGLLGSVAKPKVPQLRSPAQLAQGLKEALDPSGDVAPRLLAARKPDALASTYRALETADVTPRLPINVYVLRARAGVFGGSAPKARNLVVGGDPRAQREWEMTLKASEGSDGPVIFARRVLLADNEDGPGVELPNTVDLDGSFEKIVPGSWVVIETGDTAFTKEATTAFKATSVRPGVMRADYGMTGKVTRVVLSKNWLADQENDEDLVHPIQALRESVVYAQAERLALAQLPLTVPISGDRIQLAGVYGGLSAGRWLIVSGERADVETKETTATPGEDGFVRTIRATGIVASELAMIEGVAHTYNPTTFDDRVESNVDLVTNLSYAYVPETVTIYANVVDSTHGESKSETLGSGDGLLPHQTFTLRQPPLTYVAAPTPSGVASTLDVSANGIRWRETDAFFDAKPTDRLYTIDRDEKGTTTLTFGDGEHGARLPTGVENAKATYRSGLGKAGNVKAGQLSTPLTKPLGVTGVLNPIRASGGADRDSDALVRQNAPASVTALDRLVSVQDYADFAQTFAGVGKASAAIVSNGVRPYVHLTVAGIDDGPIEPSSDLFVNLKRALRLYGDPQQPLMVAVRDAIFLLVDVSIRADPDYEWEPLQAAIRAALLDRFSFQRMALGQPVYASQVLACVQRVPGVTCARLNALAGLPDRGSADDLLDVLGKLEDEKTAASVVPARLAHARTQDGGGAKEIAPAQIVYLTPDVAETLSIQEMDS